MSYLAGNAAQGFDGAVEVETLDDPVLDGLLNGVTIDAETFHEAAALVRCAERLGAGAIPFRMGDAALGDPAHPLHLAFLETLRDATLAGTTVELGDVAPWRDRALAARLPSDALGADYGREVLGEAILAAAGSAETRVALCAAGRIRFPDDLDLLGREAQALYELGLHAQARMRLAQCVARGGEAIAIG